MSRSRIVLAVVVALGATACADNILKERPVHRVTAAPAAAFSGAGTPESSVCAAYRRQLRHVQTALRVQSLGGKREQLKTREATLTAIVADACE